LALGGESLAKGECEEGQEGLAGGPVKGKTGRGVVLVTLGPFMGGLGEDAEGGAGGGGNLGIRKAGRTLKGES